MLLALALALTAQQWRADIDTLAAELPKRHINAFAHTSRADFTSKLEAVKADADHLTDAAIAIRLQQAVASLGDAHTEVDTRIAPMTYFPLRLARFGDGIYVTRTTAASRGACGARLLAIDGIDAYANVSSTISAENEAWLSARVPAAMPRAETLQATGVTVDAAKARFTFESAGATFDLDLEAQSKSKSLAAAPADASSPLYLQRADEKYWFVYDAARKLLYVKYNVCTDDIFRPFGGFAKDIFATADRESIDRFVVDIRNNTGGSSAVIQPLIAGLKQRPWLRGRLYAVIGRETFSSGMLAAIDLRNAGAILAGEPTGGKPNAYGEVLTFQLPSSRLNVWYATKYFSTMPGDPASVDPELRVDMTAADWFSGRDPVLEAILPAPSLAASRATTMRRRAVAPPALKCE